MPLQEYASTFKSNYM